MKKKLINKKGLLSLGQLTGIVMMLVLIGIFLTVGLRIESKMQTDIDDETNTLALTNSTLTNFNDSGDAVYMNDYPSRDYRSCSLSGVVLANATTASGAIPTTNYTVTNCYVTLVPTSSVWNNTILNLSGTMTWKYDSAAYNGVESAMEGLSNVAENQGLLGTIIIFGVIISVVVVAFMVRGGGF